MAWIKPWHRVEIGELCSRLWKLLCGVKNDILETGDSANTGEAESGGGEIWLSTTCEDILALRDIIFDEIELNQQSVESIWLELLQLYLFPGHYNKSS